MGKVRHSFHDIQFVVFDFDDESFHLIRLDKSEQVGCCHLNIDSRFLLCVVYCPLFPMKWIAWPNSQVLRFASFWLTLQYAIPAQHFITQNTIASFPAISPPSLSATGLVLWNLILLEHFIPPLLFPIPWPARLPFLTEHYGIASPSCQIRKDLNLRILLL